MGIRTNTTKEEAEVQRGQVTPYGYKARKWMAEVEAEPRLGLLGEHRLGLALFFSAGRLLRDTGCFIVIGPRA